MRARVPIRKYENIVRHGVVPEFKVVGGVSSGNVGQPGAADAIFNVLWPRDRDDEWSFGYKRLYCCRVRFADLLSCDTTWMVQKVKNERALLFWLVSGGWRHNSRDQKSTWVVLEESFVCFLEDREQGFERVASGA